MRFNGDARKTLIGLLGLLKSSRRREQAKVYVYINVTPSYARGATAVTVITSSSRPRAHAPPSPPLPIRRRFCRRKTAELSTSIKRLIYFYNDAVHFDLYMISFLPQPTPTHGIGSVSGRCTSVTPKDITILLEPERFKPYTVTVPCKSRLYCFRFARSQHFFGAGDLSKHISFAIRFRRSQITVVQRLLTRCSALAFRTRNSTTL
jgi:hypothetical protein